MKSIVFLIALLGFVSCSNTSNENQSEIKDCKYQFSGEYKYQSDKLDIVIEYNKDPRFNNYGFKIEFILKKNNHNLHFNTVSREELVNESSPNVFALPFDQAKLNVSYSFDVIELMDVKINDGYDLNYNGYVGVFNIKFLDGNEMQFECKNINKILSEFYQFTAGDETFILKNIQPNECWDYNPNVSYDNFTHSQKEFIYHDLKATYVKVATKNDMLDYVFTTQWNEEINSKLEKYGNVFLLDFNNDNEMDIAGYFQDQYTDDDAPIYFKLFLNNGISYNLAFEINIEDTQLSPIYFPSKLEGKNVLQINYVYKDLTNYLYWDKLQNKIKEHITD